MQHLSLGFHGCSQLSDAGLAALAGGLSSTLQQLSLNFELSGEGLQLGGAGLAALADGLSCTLQQFRLYFRNCLQLSDAGWAALAGGLSSTLQQLSPNV